jgi:protein-S-isoprenylcysteine O-methyltransferase Ste14
MDAGSPRDPAGRAADPAVRRANVRTAAVLVTIALVFFCGIVFAKYMGDASTSMTVLGAAVLLFLVLAIGRNLRRGK